MSDLSQFLSNTIDWGITTKIYPTPSKHITISFSKNAMRGHRAPMYCNEDVTITKEFLNSDGDNVYAVLQDHMYKLLKKVSVIEKHS